MSDFSSTSYDPNKPVTNTPHDSVPTPQFSQQQTAPAAPSFSYDLNSVNPMADLSYNSFLRGYGLDKSSAQAQASYQRGSLNAQLQAGAQGFNTQRKEGVTDANEMSAARGAARSSSNLLSQDKVVRDVNSKESAFRQGIADQQAQVAFGLQNTMNQLDTQKAEQEMQARESQVEMMNKQIAYQRAAHDLGIDPSMSSLLMYGYNGGAPLPGSY